MDPGNDRKLGKMLREEDKMLETVEGNHFSELPIRQILFVNLVQKGSMA